tara:strand:- start:10484 stop:11011 length:528 start_codon:yes stop_codon:yes gene_type:complete
MTFWSNAAAEPKRSHRFLVQFDLGTGNSVEFLARTVDKPSFNIGETEHKFLGQTYYYPGSVTWNEVKVSLVNSTTPDLDESLVELLAATGWVVPEDVASGQGVANARTINKLDAVGATPNVIIKELNGDGEVLGRWSMRNAWVKDVAFSALDYGSEDMLTVDLTFRYDWAVYNAA